MANKTFNRKKITFVWHVDNLNISHKNGDTVVSLVRKLRERYRKKEDPTIHRGKVHEYMGMKPDYCEQGKVKIDMTDYLKKSWKTCQTSIKEDLSHRQQTISPRSMRPCAS